MDVDPEGPGPESGQRSGGQRAVVRDGLAGRWLSRHITTVPPCGWWWTARWPRGTLTGMGTTAQALLLVSRRYVDLRRVCSALCRS
ncbi:hypothetical protein GCM10023222_36590 [Saccharopolyspora cebuensis]